jgi:cell division septation protein DedD
MLPDPDDRPVRPPKRGSLLPLRFFAVGFATVALTVFGGLIGYTYFSRGGGDGGPVPLIKADPRPMKIAPEKPGGMDVPHQDKEIYARIDRNAPQGKGATVERLLPPPESPMPRPRAPEPAPLAPEIPAAPALEPPPNAVEVTQPPPPAPPRPAPAPTKQAAPAPAPPPAPQQQAAPRAPAPPAAAPQQAAVPAPGAAAGAGRYRIQLAALRTSEDAAREWEKMRRTHMDVLGPLTLSVVRADLGDRGTFYRIQAGPVADEGAARDLCRRLAEKKVGCIVVRP